MFNLKRRSKTEQDPLPAILEAALGESPREAERLGMDWYRQREIVKQIWHESATVSLGSSLERANQRADTNGTGWV